MVGNRKSRSAGWIGVAAAVLLAAPAAARPIPGFGDLIDEYCISRGRLRVAAHQPHCAMCHQPGTFDNLPADRVEPNLTEYERGKATGDFSFFCPGGATAAPAAASPSASTAPPAADAVAPPPSSPVPATPGRMGMGMEGGEGHRPGGGEMGGTRSMGLPSALPAGSMSQAVPPMSMGVPAGPPAASTSVPMPAMGRPSAPATGQPGAAAMPERPPIAPAEVEQRLTKLSDEIRIGDAQRASWDAFAEGVRSAAVRHREFAEAAAPPLSISADAVALLQLQQRRLSARIAAIRSVSTVFTRLLAVLDENQRKTANERFASVLEVM